MRILYLSDDGLIRPLIYMSKYKISFGFVLLAIFGLVSNEFHFFRNTVVLTRQILSPFSTRAISRSQSLPNFFNNILEIGKLINENEKLKNENYDLLGEVARLKEVEKENQTLKQEMQIKIDPHGRGLIVAKIVAKSPSSFNQTIFLSAGEKQGVKVNDPVIGRSHLIGKIEKVNQNSSQAILINNHRFLMPVILSESRALGLMRGGLDGVVVEQIPADQEINIGEQIITSGISEDFPYSFLVGSVAEKISGDSEISQTVLVSQPIKINELETVFVLGEK
ncbi:MAG: MreC [Candidatus Berkelbacteria bacterium Licking1014_7]|uniref:Cell shape-determining protein MreC n=1 Tax=Candidatus Berkelbacteria bacterium Licking1014_7 TaxID=2017147 RepID=A0A554LIS5_9BACT|nr:MAG: MreC [Candidatus Berkelbacteria bacterium Licking1014_7]